MDDPIRMQFCVIGDPIAHSRSPEIHHFVFRELGLSHEYSKQHITASSLPFFVEEVREKKHYSGFNVTVPHKQYIMPLLDQVEPFAKNVGAVNTVHLVDEKLIGYNTDIPGCRTALEKSGCSAPEKVAQIGCGGAARASIQAVLSMGAKEIVLFDLDQKKVQEMQDTFQERGSALLLPGDPDTARMKNSLKQCDLIINATPVGMWPDVERSPVPEVVIPEGITVLDMVYNPLETRLIKMARSKGCSTASGLMMLVAQALAADKIWLNADLPESLLDRVYNFLKKGG